MYWGKHSKFERGKLETKLGNSIPELKKQKRETEELRQIVRRLAEEVKEAKINKEDPRSFNKKNKPIFKYIFKGYGFYKFFEKAWKLIKDTAENI